MQVPILFRAVKLELVRFHRCIIAQGGASTRRAVREKVLRLTDNRGTWNNVQPECRLCPYIPVVKTKGFTGVLGNVGSIPTGVAGLAEIAQPVERLSETQKVSSSTLDLGTILGRG